MSFINDVRRSAGLQKINEEMSDMAKETRENYKEDQISKRSTKQKKKVGPSLRKHLITQGAKLKVIRALNIEGLPSTTRSSVDADKHVGALRASLSTSNVSEKEFIDTVDTLGEASNETKRAYTMSQLKAAYAYIMDGKINPDSVEFPTSANKSDRRPQMVVSDIIRLGKEFSKRLEIESVNLDKVAEKSVEKI